MHSDLNVCVGLAPLHIRHTVIADLHTPGGEGGGEMQESGARRGNRESVGAGVLGQGGHVC